MHFFYMASLYHRQVHFHKLVMMSDLGMLQWSHFSLLNCYTALISMFTVPTRAFFNTTIHFIIFFLGP